MKYSEAYPGLTNPGVIFFHNGFKIIKDDQLIIEVRRPRWIKEL